MSSSPFEQEAVRKVSTELGKRPELRLWTDDYNNLFQILKK